MVRGLSKYKHRVYPILVRVVRMLPIFCKTCDSMRFRHRYDMCRECWIEYCRLTREALWDGLRGRAACALAAESGRGRQDNSMKNQSTIETETRGGSCDPVTGSAAVEREKRVWWAVAVWRQLASTSWYQLQE